MSNPAVFANRHSIFTVDIVMVEKVRALAIIEVAVGVLLNQRPLLQWRRH